MRDFPGLGPAPITAPAGPPVRMPPLLAPSPLAELCATSKSLGIPHLLLDALQTIRRALELPLSEPQLLLLPGPLTQASPCGCCLNISSVRGTELGKNRGL